MSSRNHYAAAIVQSTELSVELRSPQGQDMSTSTPVYRTWWQQEDDQPRGLSSRLWLWIRWTSFMVVWYMRMAVYVQTKTGILQADVEEATWTETPEIDSSAPPERADGRADARLQAHSPNMQGTVRHAVTLPVCNC